MAANTSTSPILESLTAVIDFLPGATMLLDRQGVIRHCNRAAARMLGIGDSRPSIYDLVADREPLKKSFGDARRSSGSLPFSFEISGQDGRISGHVKPVMTEPGRAPEHLLITCYSHDDAGYKMRMLNRELDRSLDRQKALRQQNLSLRQTVERTLPRLREQVVRDSLTGCFNRRYFDRQLRREWTRAMRQDAPVSLIYADIDHFKEFNDQLGHHRGDLCLQAVADALQRAVTREFDCVCRIGGEEFALLLPMTEAEGARKVAQRALFAVRRRAIRHPGNVVKIVTASFGVGTCRPSAELDPERFAAAVDRAMYRAKRSGRNRISISEDATHDAWHDDDPSKARAAGS